MTVAAGTAQTEWEPNLARTDHIGVQIIGGEIQVDKSSPRQPRHVVVCRFQPHIRQINPHLAA